MASPRHNPHLFTWRRFTNCKTPKKKVQLNNGDIDQWMKRVEMASEFAVSEVFSRKKPHSGISRQAMALQSTDQLQDHDDAYTEAQALLTDWMNSKLCLEMEEEDDLIGSSEKSCPVASVQPTALDYSKFDDLYNHLAKEEESYAVNNFLQDLMERDVVDSGIVEDLELDSEQKKKQMRDPTVTMEARHRQVRENRAWRDAERARQQREREAQREAREEARRRERDEETRRRQEARQQEQMVKQEMAKLRRQMEERGGVEQLARQRERERLDRQQAARSLKPDLSLLKAQQHQDTERLHREQQIQAGVHMLNLKCLQRHFSGWYSVLLERRVRMGKAAALCDWRRQLRAWRAWRALVWAGRKQKEAEKTEEELRAENRRCQLATESDRRRLLRRCLNEWQLWCRRVKEQRELLAQQEETRRKMAALIDAAAAGELKTTERTANEPSVTQPETSCQPEAAEKQGHRRSDPPASAPCPTSQGDSSTGAAAKPVQPWQVNRQHTAPSASELLRAQRGVRDGGRNAARSRSTTSRGGRFENRHTTQQRVIAEQKRLLREQQEQIARLQEEQSMMGLKLGAQRAAQGLNLDPKEQRAPSVPRDGGCCSAPRKEAPQPCPHPMVMAMEERARQRVERRREVEELKRKKEEEKLAQMKVAEEERQREEEEERLRAVERRKVEKRQEREREQEKQRQLDQERRHQNLARKHHRTLLLRRGLAPWQRLLHLSQSNQQLARDHHNISVLRRCILAWQHMTGDSLAQKRASADQLLHHFLLRRSLNCWKRLKDWRIIQEERAEHFYRQRSLRRAVRALLDYVMEERLAEWDRKELAQQHSDRRALRSCFLAWREFPCLLRQERQREVRLEQLRRRVAEVLPDFRSSPLECPSLRNRTHSGSCTKTHTQSK